MVMGREEKLLNAQSLKWPENVEILALIAKIFLLTKVNLGWLFLVIASYIL